MAAAGGEGLLFEGLLKECIGLDAGSIGSSAVERAVRARQSACHLEDQRAYWECVRDSATERQALVEAVVVPETWFFRDGQAFAEMVRLGREAARHMPEGGTLRLLSVPCSTGEEPYSMAMALIEAGIPPDSFQIDAVDISARALASATGAVYGKNSFRGNDLEFRTRHFRGTPQGFRLDDAVRRTVHFQQGNLLASDFLLGAGRYDLIFCRNLLIYFDCATQAHAVDVLVGLLAPNGVLFVAPAETAVMLNHGFASTKAPLAYAFLTTGGLRTARPLDAPRPAAAARRARGVRLERAGTPKAATARPPPVATVATVATVVDRGAEPRAELDAAVRWADQGRFAEAAACCEEHLRRHGPSAEAFHLLALVRDASGNHRDASACYRKALYLDPEHHEALIHFALLAEQQGHPAQAQALRNRARRVEQAGKT
jgi:chemotaxis protein methyltransferase WspC